MKRGRESIAGRRNSVCGAPGGREGSEPQARKVSIAEEQEEGATR